MPRPAPCVAPRAAKLHATGVLQRALCLARPRAWDATPLLVDREHGHLEPIPCRSSSLTVPPQRLGQRPPAPASLSIDWALAHGEQPIRPSAHFSFGLLRFFPVL